MRVGYTITDGKIKIISKNNDDVLNMIRVFDLCLPSISFANFTGITSCKTSSFFKATKEQGVIISVQLVKNNSCFEFSTDHSIELNFSPSIASIQLMFATISFSHKYEPPGQINRFDIFIPQEKVSALLSPELVNELNEKKILNLKNNKSLMSNRSLNQLLKSFEKPINKSLCIQLEKFLRSVEN